MQIRGVRRLFSQDLLFWIKAVYRAGVKSRSDHRTDLMQDRENRNRSATILGYLKKPSGVVGNSKVLRTDCHLPRFSQLLTMCPWSG